MNQLVKILLIDDDSAFPEIFEDQLRRAEPDLNFTVDAVAKIDQYTSFDHDVYIVDHVIFNRPVSVDIIEAIRQDHPEAVIYVLSGQGDFDLLKQLSKLGIAGFIDKNDEDVSDIAGRIKHISAIKDKLRCLSMKFADAGVA